MIVALILLFLVATAVCAIGGVVVPLTLVIIAQITFYVHCEQAEALECHHPGLTDEGAPYSRLRDKPSAYNKE